MKIKQIRNATIRIEYAGKTFLVDPWLEKKHDLGSFEDIPGRPFHVPDPVKEHLPMPFCRNRRRQYYAALIIIY